MIFEVVIVAWLLRQLLLVEYFTIRNKKTVQPDSKWLGRLALCAGMGEALSRNKPHRFGLSKIGI